MSEYRDRYGSATAETEKIDLMRFLPDIWQGIRKLWWLVLGLAVIFAVKSYFSVSTSYEPVYVAEATMSVQNAGTSGDYANSQAAKQLETVFPYILTSGVLKEVIADDMGVDVLPGTIKAEAEQGTNLFTLSATADDPQVAYNLLQSVIKNYPQVAEFVIGQTKLEILDETGIPTDTNRKVVIRGSYKRGALKGALLGLLIMAVYILTRRTVKTRKELKQVVNLPDFGSLPYIRVKKRKKDTFFSTVSLLNERVPQGYLEAIRKLCIKVMKEMDQKEYQTLLVTSSIPGEGKTTISTNLALAATKRGQNVILVDCDPRNPSVASVMNEQGEHPALGQVIRGKVSLDEALVKVDVDGGSLHVLYGGKPDEKAARLLGTKAMKTLIEQLKEKADLIIFDTAPSELLADASALARHIDAACYVVRENHAKKREIRAGVQALDMSGIDILGYVFNGDTSVRHRAYGYGYSYGYKRYGRYDGHGGLGKYGKEFQAQEGETPTDQYGRVIKD